MKTHKPLATKKPPIPSDDDAIIEQWLADLPPKINPLVTQLCSLITQQLEQQSEKPKFAIKWGSAFFGIEEHGWIVQVSAYSLSANIVFLNGNKLADPPELGDETRYVKLRAVEELQDEKLIAWIKESSEIQGWQWS